MKALIIGFGSIGKRHAEVLQQINSVDLIGIVTKQDLEGFRNWHSVNEAPLEQFDYLIISSETEKHLWQIQEINKRVRDKLILVEKPICMENQDIPNDIGTYNKVYIGYNLRFHPILEYIKERTRKQKILCATISAGQYLPEWRPGRDYSKSYSASVNGGGGVILDLSHEIDYLQWICGEIKEVKTYWGKVSELNIETEDFCHAVGKTQNDVQFQLSIDYLSHIPHRDIFVICEHFTIKADLIANHVTERNINGFEEKREFKNLQRDDTYCSMHETILTNINNHTCTLDEGLHVINAIRMIKHG